MRTLVFSLMALSRLAVTRMSMSLNERFEYGALTRWKKRFVPPYMSACAMTSSPDLSRCSTDDVAARPDENATPNLPFSSAATLASKALRVGLPVRAYS